MRLQVATPAADFDPVSEGNRLRRAMRVADLVQEVVAMKAGLDPSVMSRMLRGRRPLSPQAAARIQAAITILAPDEDVA